MSYIDSIPILFFGLLIILVLSFLIEIGYRIGKLTSNEQGLSKHPIEASVSSAILSLMAFMLGFSFANAVSRYTNRQNLMLEDANTASTLYLRADFLPPEKVTPARNLIREYVTLRTEAISSAGEKGFKPAIHESAIIQNKLWEMAVDARRESNSISFNLYISALNDLIDTDSKRQTAGFIKRFPPPFWWSMVFLGGMSTGMMGYISGLHGRRSPVATTSLIIAFSVVIMLIIDLDRPVHSLFKQQDIPGENILKNMTP